MKKTLCPGKKPQYVPTYPSNDTNETTYSKTMDRTVTLNENEITITNQATSSDLVMPPENSEGLAGLSWLLAHPSHVPEIPGSSSARCSGGLPLLPPADGAHSSQGPSRWTGSPHRASVSSRFGSASCGSDPRVFFPSLGLFLRAHLGL